MVNVKLYNEYNYYFYIFIFKFIYDTSSQKLFEDKIISCV